MSAALTQAPTSHDLLPLLYRDRRELPGFLAISVPGSNGGMETVWSQDLDQAARWIAKLVPKANAYVGLGLHRTKGSRTQRGTAADVMAIPSLWIELDVGGPTHGDGGKHYFPTKAAARAFLEALPHPPSVIVDSGGGLHAYWLFRELWVFEDEAERLDAAALVEGWQRFLQRRAKEQDTDIDSTFDLARVLRVAPSLNHKVNPPLPVMVILEDGPLYNPSDFDEFSAPVGTGAPAASATFTLNHTALRSAKADALILNDARAAAAWEGKKPKFTSPSEADLSFADYCVAAGFSDQEIVDDLVARRREHGLNLKRADYYARTIAKARSGTFGTSTTVAGHPEGCQCAGCVEARQSPAEKLSIKLGLPVTRIVKRGRIGGSYELTLADGGAVIFGGADALLSFPKCRAAVLDTVAAVLPAGLRIPWPDVAGLIARSAEVIELPTEGEEVIGWLTSGVVDRTHRHCNDLKRFLEGDDGVGEKDIILKVEEDGRTCLLLLPATADEGHQLRRKSPRHGKIPRCSSFTGRLHDTAAVAAGAWTFKSPETKGLAVVPKRARRCLARSDLRVFHRGKRYP